MSSFFKGPEFSGPEFHPPSVPDTAVIVDYVDMLIDVSPEMIERESAHFETSFDGIEFDITATTSLTAHRLGYPDQLMKFTITDADGKCLNAYYDSDGKAQFTLNQFIFTGEDAKNLLAESLQLLDDITQESIVLHDSVYSEIAALRYFLNAPYEEVDEAVQNLGSFNSPTSIKADIDETLHDLYERLVATKSAVLETEQTVEGQQIDGTFVDTVYKTTTQQFEQGDEEVGNERAIFAALIPNDNDDHVVSVRKFAVSNTEKLPRSTSTSMALDEYERTDVTTIPMPHDDLPALQGDVLYFKDLLQKLLH